MSRPLTKCRCRSREEVCDLKIKVKELKNILRSVFRDMEEHIYVPKIQVRWAIQDALKEDKNLKA